MTSAHWLAAACAGAAGLPIGWAVGGVVARFTGCPRAWAWATTVAAFAAMGLRFGGSATLPAFCYLAAAAVALAFIDARVSRLPDPLTLTSYPVAAALLGVAAAVLPHGPALFGHAVVGAAVALAFYLLLAVISPAGIGWGDVKLSGVIGLYLGWLGVRAFLAGLVGGFLLAAVVGVALITAGRASRKTQLPFGPFMLAAAVAAVLASPFMGS
jgi:prepilin signal peptidase PulO-like enzyme (type II secretory pathway)